MDYNHGTCVLMLSIHLCPATVHIVIRGGKKKRERERRNER